jgi:hypothetical protein
MGDGYSCARDVLLAVVVDREFFRLVDRCALADNPQFLCACSYIFLTAVALTLVVGTKKQGE